MKRYLLSNLRYWIEEYGFDGFRWAARSLLLRSSAPALVGKTRLDLGRTTACSLPDPHPITPHTPEDTPPPAPNDASEGLTA